MGRLDSIKFTQGSPFQAEKQLNAAVKRINNSDVLDSGQKLKMVNKLIKKFEKQLNVKVSDTGSMAGRSLRDRMKATGAELFYGKQKYRIRTKGDTPYGFFRPVFSEKVASVADHILKKHGH